MADDDLRALERTARSKSEFDCVRYWQAAIRAGLAGSIRDQVAAAVLVDRLEWAVPILETLRALAGEKRFKIGDWVRVVNKRLATRGCYGRVRFPTLTAGRDRGHLKCVELRTTRGFLPCYFAESSIEMTVDPGPQGEIYAVASEVRNERRRKPRARDDAERSSRLAESMAKLLSARGRLGSNRA